MRPLRSDCRHAAYWRHLVIILTVLQGCATTEFRSFEANNKLFEGRGGIKVVVDGMEIWYSGDPPRRFTVLGIIDDQRPVGIIPMAQLRGDLVKKAREA